MKSPSILLVLSISVLISGCPNHVYSMSYSPITSEYREAIDKVYLGMTKAQLRRELPNLVVRGQTYVDGEVVEALELQHNYWSGVGGRLIHDRMWFYFHGGKLVKWGEPDDWPQKPDLIIERRSR